MFYCLPHDFIKLLYVDYTLFLLVPHCVICLLFYCAIIVAYSLHLTVTGYGVISCW